MEIPKGSEQKDIKTRRQIIKEFYADWVANNPDKIIWNESLRENIHVKFSSLNEVLGHAPRSYESTYAFTQLTDILKNAKYVESFSPKPNNQNQKIFSRISILRWREYRVLVGRQKSTGDMVLYYIGSGPKNKKAAR
ncbi:MAG: hypothetical protein IKX45_05180 [Bacteroidales bacterium]|nr:hypothetical protein [Bacteroidales bacterium]